jgi:hypothetical protein
VEERRVIIFSVITGYISFVGFPGELSIPFIPASEPVPATESILDLAAVPAFEPVQASKQISASE